MKREKIYTRKGDLGTTSLGTGERVNKTDLRTSAYGTVDELNSTLGAARAFSTNADTRKLLLKIQNKIMNMMSMLAAKEQILTPTISEMDIVGMEKSIDYFNQFLPPISNFIIPGNNKPGAMLDIARTTCRRAEREVLRLSETEIVDPIIHKFLNRLSDLLFVLERIEYLINKIPENFWKK
ncbi:cob(I)yrinic acid a,c-diamide adenosyltransferase [candidate division Kazan bacterium]|uniref:Corrinoid adenosyltransferase n=1 Tax=candidate division Kazan bacterium TaxID=2202143 RepID=A0A420ZD03_UNCK3|nr:MAG: cob(I)yrinic acid a,c-diamide adenosyltransferase [candidate division Kazan bacterium]